jgi:hypothetical protein
MLIAELGSKEISEDRREIEEAAPLCPFGVDSRELGELFRAHGLLCLQDLGQRRSGAGAAAGGEEEPGAVDGAAVAVLGARRRRAVGGAVAVSARGGAGGGDLLDVHEGGEEVVLGADLVEAVAAGPTAAASEVEVFRQAEGDLRSGPAVVRPEARSGRGRRREGWRRPPWRIGGLRLLHCGGRALSSRCPARSLSLSLRVSLLLSLRARERARALLVPEAVCASRSGGWIMRHGLLRLCFVFRTLV